MTDLSPAEFARLFDDAVSSLESDARSILDRFSVCPQRAVHEFIGVGGPAAAPVWIVARSGDIVLGYDEVEEEYGIGTLKPNGVVDDWGTFGDRLRWSLIRFPTSTF